MPNGNWFVGYSWSSDAGSHGFGRCFALDLNNLKNVEATLSKDLTKSKGVPTTACIISLTPLTKKQYRGFK